LTTLRHGHGDGPLSDVVWNAPSGTTISLAAGSYRGPLIPQNEICIEATAGLGTVTVHAARGSVLSAEGAGRITLRRLVLRGPAHGLGALIKVYNPTRLMIEDCLLTGGRAEGEGGGAIDVQAGEVDVSRCRFTRNVALQGGAIRVGGVALARVSNCVFDDNTAQGESSGGGAVFANMGGVAEVRNCTFANNKGRHGSALLAGRGGTGGRIEVDHTLFSSAQQGLVIAVHAPGVLNMQHCVVAKIAEMISEGVVVGVGVVERAVPLRDEPPKYQAMFDAQLAGLGNAARVSDLPNDVYGRPRGSVLVGAVG
jgi:hypothetical protein